LGALTQPITYELAKIGYDVIHLEAHQGGAALSAYATTPASTTLPPSPRFSDRDGMSATVGAASSITFAANRWSESELGQ